MDLKDLNGDHRDQIQIRGTLSTSESEAQEKERSSLALRELRRDRAIEHMSTAKPKGLGIGPMNENIIDGTTNFTSATTSGVSGSNQSRFATGPVQSREGINPETTTENDQHLVAIIERKGGEIGLAAIDIRSSALIISQYKDSRSYVHTMHKLDLFRPVEILFPQSNGDSSAFQGKLGTIIADAFPNSQVLSIGKKYFSDMKGSLMLKQLATNESLFALELDAESRYLALASAAALLKYFEHVQNVTFAAGSLPAVFQGIEGHMTVDSATISSLEIVSNVRTGETRSSLFGFLNHCSTPMGSRVLRSSILQPTNDIPTLNLRLDCIEELLKNERMFSGLLNVLKKFIDLDHLASQLIQTPKTTTVKTAQTAIHNMILLKSTLETLPMLFNALEAAKNPLLSTVCGIAADSRVQMLQKAIDDIIHTETNLSKNHLNMKVQHCFSVKSGANGLLDVARKTYTESVEDISALLEQYRVDYDLPGLAIKHHNKRGYYFSLSGGNIHSMPPIFVQVQRQGKYINCSTSELISLNERAKEVRFLGFYLVRISDPKSTNKAVNEIYLLTERIIDSLMHLVRKNIGWIHRLSEGISLLDMLSSFAIHITENEGYVRPEFTEDGPIAISEGRHPLLERAHSQGPPLRQSFGHTQEPTIRGIELGTEYVPNDTYMSPGTNVQIITGANMSGKSTYLRQVAMIVYMSHLGCFVPAKFASIRSVDRLLTRIGTGDSIEGNASSFMLEMKEMAHIVQNATSKSLIVVDELGRSTSTKDGAGLAWAFCEYLRTLNAYTLFVTHFHELTQLEAIYPNVKNFHMKSVVQMSSHSSMFEADSTRTSMQEGEGGGGEGEGERVPAMSGVKFTYNVKEGGTPEAPQLVFRLAAVAGFPREIIAEANDISKELRQKKIQTLRKQQMEMGGFIETGGVTLDLMTIYRISDTLLSLKHSSMTDEGLRNYLITCKKRFIP